MYQFHDELALAHMHERLDEARAQRRGQQIAIARRKARKARRASVQARLVLLRSL